MISRKELLNLSTEQIRSFFDNLTKFENPFYILKTKDLEITLWKNFNGTFQLEIRNKDEKISTKERGISIGGLELDYDIKFWTVVSTLYLAYKNTVSKEFDKNTLKKKMISILKQIDNEMYLLEELYFRYLEKKVEEEQKEIDENKLNEINKKIYEIKKSVGELFFEILNL